MSRDPNIKSTDRDTNSRKRDKQDEKRDSGFSMRYVARLADINLKDADISRATGIPTSTLSRYRNGGNPKSEHIFPLADALKCSARWLIAGTDDRTHLSDASDTEWIKVPEHDLRRLSPTGLGEPVTTTLFRRDWLNRAFGADHGLWLTALPSDYPGLGLQEGEQVLCRDISREELRERMFCIWWAPLFNHLIVARFSIVDRGPHLYTEEGGDYWADPGLVESGDLVPVGRIVGRPLSPIR